MLVVVDASVIAPALADDGPDGDRARSTLSGQELAAPALIDLEVASVIRRRFLGGFLDERRARLALTDLADLAIQRAPHASLLARCWELRQNLTIHDAAYVALAEALDTTLVTADARLAGAPGIRCSTHVVQAIGRH